MLNIAFPLPPLAEQHRIVTRVNELMALCDYLEFEKGKREDRRDRLVMASLTRVNLPPQSTKEGETEAEAEHQEHVRFHLTHLPRLATKPEHIKDLRQTILNLAVRGKLVPQDPNDEPAEKILQKIIKQRSQLENSGAIRPAKLLAAIEPQDVPFTLPIGWKWTRLGGIVLYSDSGLSPKAESFPRYNSNWGVLKVSAVSWDVFNPEENKQLLPEVTPPERAIINKGDLLISRANTSELIAKCVIVEDDPVNLIMSDKIVRLHISLYCNQDFIRIVNNHAYYAREYYVKRSSGTSKSMQNITRQGIYELPIPLPPYVEQQRIVAKVGELMALCDQLEHELTQNEKTSSQLLETLLREALDQDFHTTGAIQTYEQTQAIQSAVSKLGAESTAMQAQQPQPMEAQLTTKKTKATKRNPTSTRYPEGNNRHTAASAVQPQDMILDHMQPGQKYTRADIIDDLNLSVGQWNAAIRELKEQGHVVQTGQKRGARYSLV